MNIEDELNFEEVENKGLADITSITGMPEHDALVAAFYHNTKENKALIEAHLATINLKHNQYFFVMPSTMFRSVAKQIDAAFPDGSLVAKAIMFHFLTSELLKYGMELFAQKSRDYLTNRKASALRNADDDEPIVKAMDDWYKTNNFENPDLN